MATETAGVGGLKIAETFPGRPGQPAWMRAEGRDLQGRSLGPTRSLQGISRRHHEVAIFGGQSPGSTEGGGDWPPSVRSLRHERHNAEEISGAQCVRKQHRTTAFRGAKPLQTDNSIYPRRRLFYRVAANALPGLRPVPDGNREIPDKTKTPGHA